MHRIRQGNQSGGDRQTRQRAMDNDGRHEEHCDDSEPTRAWEKHSRRLLRVRPTRSAREEGGWSQLALSRLTSNVRARFGSEQAPTA